MKYVEPLVTADKIIELFETHNMQSMVSSIIYDRLGGKSNPHIQTALKRLTEIDKHLNYSNGYYTYSGSTEIFISEGKYKGICEKQSTDETINKQRAALSDRKLEVDLANAERVYKTYPSTRFMAITATIVSVCLLLLRLAEVFGILDRLKLWFAN
ncbi:MAG: hypothetical protein IT252_12110 [Chitinophagaceae bacterium]|nr:hypothetical protein [Chitinophagaceae bacterium]